MDRQGQRPGRRWRGPASRRRGEPGAPAGGPPGNREAAAERFKRACRTFGVVLAPAAGGLDRLDSYLYRPLRDASLLTTKLLDGEVAERAGRGVPLRRAEESAGGGRVRMGAGGADEVARRMGRRRVTFQACDADFQSPGGREVRRAIFVTALLIRDAVRSRAKKVPPQSFAPTYREVLDRYKAATANLVLDGHPAAPRRHRSLT